MEVYDDDDDDDDDDDTEDDGDSDDMFPFLFFDDLFSIFILG